MDVKSNHNHIIKSLLKKVANNKRTCRVTQHDMSAQEYSTYWDGGSISYYTIIDIVTGQARTMHTNHPFFEKGRATRLPIIEANEVVVRHGYFCGKVSTASIYAKDLSILGL